MTGGEYLAAWQQRSRLTDRQAAEWVELSVSAYRRQKTGKVKGTAQTEKLARMYELVDLAWLDIAETSLRIGRTLERLCGPRLIG